MARYVNIINCPTSAATAKIPYSFTCEHCGKRSVKFIERTEYAHGRPGNLEFKGNWRFSGLGTPVDISVDVLQKMPGSAIGSKISYSSNQLALIEVKAKEELMEMIEKLKKQAEEGDFSTLKLMGADFKCAHCRKKQTFVKRMAKLRIQSNPKSGTLNAFIIAIMITVWIFLLPASVMNHSIILFLILAAITIFGCGWMFLRKKHSPAALLKQADELENAKKQQFEFGWSANAIEIKTAQNAGELMLKLQGAR